MKGLSQSGHWPSGNPRWYLRRAGHKAVAMPDLPKDHPGFVAAWAAAAGGGPVPPQRPAAGTIGAMIVAFRASAAYQNRAASTRDYLRRHLEAIRATWGHAEASTLQPHHIRADLARLPPHPANTRLRAWRALCRWSFEEGALLAADPSAQIRKRAAAASEGHRAWTRDDVARFRAHWGHGTPQRLAFELLHRTAAAIGDACTLGPGMVRDGWLHYVRRKSGSAAVCPMTAATAPAWFEHSDDLAECLRQQPRHLVYLLTAQGAPRSPKAASQWFAAACRAAGLTGLSAHGLRKHRAAVFMENGASDAQRMAILGHETTSEARRYARSADLMLTVTGAPISNPPAQISN